MAAFDANHWYQINLQGLFENRSMVGQPPQSPETTGNVLFKITDNTSKGRFWQLYPLDDTRYILRSQSSSPDTYLAIQNDANTAKGSVAIMRNVSDAHDEIFWKITAFRNGGYMLSNVANGTNWHLHAENTNTVSMTNNITGEQDNQKFSFSTSRSIDNVAFSSIKLPSGVYTTLASASFNRPSSGLAQGTKTAIAVFVSVGVLLLVAAIVGMCFILRRQRKKQSGLANSTQFDKAELGGTHEQHSAEPAIKYRSEAQELDGQYGIQELGDHEHARGAGSLAELPADGPNDRRY